MTSLQQRAELHRQIWAIANEVRGAVDGWDFKQYVLGALFYRFISENFTSYIEAGDDSVQYAGMADSDIGDEIKDDAVRTKGYFIAPSQLFCNVAKRANTNDRLNADLNSIFVAIESSASGYPSEAAIKGLFADFDTTSNRLGSTVKEKNIRLAAVLKGVEGLALGDFDAHQIDLFGDAYEFLISNYAANAGKSGGEFFTPQHVSKLIAQLAMHGQTSVNKIYDPVAVDAFKAEHFLDDEKLAALQSIRLPSEREVQDYRSSYNDIRDWQRKERESNVKGNTTVSWDDVVFEVDLLKSQEINLDYILELIFEYNKQHPNKETLKEEVTRLIRASLGNRAKEGLMLEFIGQTDIDNLPNKESVIEQFYTFAQAAQQREAEALIQEENLNHDAARRYISASLKREYATENGTALNEALPKLSPLNPQYKTKKKTVFQKVSAFIDKFKGVGGGI
ncbi:type I restriction-modification system subunit M [Raoultella ornithinolytica]|uniref:type I restriction-modification system subunit M n=1 Tax=Raoultella ornithinolytica TaxID=54291 RepID=UPI003608E7EC